MKRTRSVISIILAAVLCLTAVCPAMGAEASDIQMEAEASDVREEAEKLPDATEPEQNADEPAADEYFAQEGEQEPTEITEPEQVEEDREAVADNVTGESVAQAIWTKKNAVLTFYYGPQVSAGDRFNGETVTDVWSGTDVTDSGSYPQWNDQIDVSVKRVVFDTSFLAVKPKSTRCWFYLCEYLKKIDLSGLDTSNVTDMRCMFYGCRSLENPDVSGFDTSNVTDMHGMFYECYRFASLDVSGFDTSNVADMGEMFSDCINLTSLDASGFDTSNVTDMAAMFKNCESLISLNVSGLDTSNVTDMTSMFEGCTSLKSLDVRGFKTSGVTSMKLLFNNCESLTSLNVSGFDTSGVTDMFGMFEGCANLKSLNVSGFNMSNVTNIGGMFRGCTNLKSLNLGELDTPNVTNMADLFKNCANLTNLDVSWLDTSNVAFMAGMFDGCAGLISLNVSGLDTSGVTEMINMFQNCVNLKSLDVSGFDTSNVTSMEGMFSHCESVTSLNVSGFDVSNVTDISYMFDHCTNLKTIYCKDSRTNWSKIYGKEVFNDCDALVGADGDAQIAFHTGYDDASKAKAASLRGYFTTKGSVPKLFINKCAISLSSKCLIYTGKRLTPTVVIEDGSKTLAENTDYELRFENCVDVGTASVIITGKGDYTGTVTAKYLIKVGKTARGDMFNLAGNVKVTWKEVPGAKYYKVYREGITDRGESLKEPVIVTMGLVGWDQEPGLTNGNAYRYRIVASTTGRGDSTGDSRLSYSKVMYRLKTVVIRSVKNTEPGKVTVRYDKTTSGDSYVLQYSERQDMVGAMTKVVLGANNTSYTIGGLKKGRTYYVSIRVRKKVNGIDYYTTFGVPKKITVTK